MGSRDVLAIGGITLRCANFSLDINLASAPATTAEGVAGSNGAGSPATTGGGNSNPSAALRESCRAKSEACHHSRNLRENIEVGNSI